MKTIKTLTALSLSVILCACAPKALMFDIHNAPDNERCDYMKEVCREAQRFQSRYESMSREEKEDARAVMNAFVQQCQDAQKMCRQTMD